ncbi:MAG TPA: glycosyltransferase [Candidatus Omnitrophota bacterium]|nr:glycosyltransferase [Candidatus Omnitrophota bacterium]HPT07977.1 glycosyltransferase [Candidatus Omnitrophota bacterium]
MNKASCATVTVSITTFNRNADLSRCLDALTKQTDTDFSVVIVNGGDESGVRATAAKFPALHPKIVTQKRTGIVEARNLCWQEASTDIVCIIDDDLVVSPGWLTEVRQTFAADESIGGVSGPSLIPDDRQTNRDFAFYIEQFRSSKNPFFRILGLIYFNIILENKITDIGRILKSGAFSPGSNFKSCLVLPAPVEVDYLEACNMSYRRDLFVRLGGFDYLYEGTGEWNEPDFCFRLKNAGYTLVFNPRAVAWHCISQEGVYSARTNSYERIRNFIFFYMRWIKPNTLEKFFRFSANIIFIDLYWIFKFFQSRNPDWLRGLSGTVTGFIDARRICK